MSGISETDLFRRLPGELLIHILTFVLVPETPVSETLASYTARATPFRLVSLRFNAAVEAIAGIHAHSFPGPLMRPINIQSISRHPTPHSSVNAHHQYWSCFLPPRRDQQRHQFAQNMLRYLTIGRLPSLRSVSIDFVIPSFKRKRGCADWTPYDESLILPALERMRAASHSIEHAYIRLPPSQRCIDLVESIIANNIGLQSLCVEVDSTVSPGHVKPKLRLNNFTLAHVKYTLLQRFVLRAPSCDIDFIVAPHRQRPFLNRLADVKEFGLVSYSFASTLPNWYWLYVLLRSSSALVLCDVAFAMPDDHLPRSRPRIRQFRMPHLQQLSIHIPEITTQMLRRMRAPFLHTLRLRSAVHIERWPTCPEDHFPSLFIVNVICPGPSGARMEALGIEFDNFNHNFGAGHSYYRASRDDFIAYIKPYDRARPKPSVQPYHGRPFRRLAPPSNPPASPSSTSPPIATPPSTPFITPTSAPSSSPSFYPSSPSTSQSRVSSSAFMR